MLHIIITVTTVIISQPDQSIIPTVPQAQVLEVTCILVDWIVAPPINHQHSNLVLKHYHDTLLITRTLRLPLRSLRPPLRALQLFNIYGHMLIIIFNHPWYIIVWLMDYSTLWNVFTETIITNNDIISFHNYLLSAFFL